MVFSKLKALDAFPKINEDFFSRTASGGVITIVSSVVMVLLFLSEVRLFLMPKQSHELTIDTSRGEQITINVSLAAPPLYLLTDRNLGQACGLAQH